jgi:hypothetical protein
MAHTHALHPRYTNTHDPDSAGRKCSAPYQDLTTAIRHYREILVQAAPPAQVEAARATVRRLVAEYAALGV